MLSPENGGFSRKILVTKMSPQNLVLAKVSTEILGFLLENAHLRDHLQCPVQLI